MKKLIVALAAVLAASSAAQAQVVKDFVDVEGARANKIRGYGVVTGLNGQGDSPRGESARVVRAMLQNLVAPDAAVQELNARNAALVLVSSELAPFQKEGTRIDVSLSVVGDAKSLAGGELQITDLRGPMGRRDPNVYALASGRVIVQGDARRANQTVATIPGGAIVEKPLQHTFVKEKSGRKSFSLVLKKPDLTEASQLTFQINSSALSGSNGKRDVAAAVDGGLIEVRIPSIAEYREVTGVAPAVDYEQEPVRWLEVILNQPVTFFRSETASVVINDGTKAVSWTGEVRLRAGSVILPAPAPGTRPGLFHAKEGQTLSEFMDRVGPALTDQQLVDVVKALHAAGLIKADVKSQ
ncbi:MAG TPA: flagellar basal body P-ring protein FlgI [Planctomycetota bacterium]|jgi:flagellar P-ring protein precursor FlgI|nr:flagellar basal body P-ring protein FlgI [Planctomycetota bacterium]